MTNFNFILLCAPALKMELNTNVTRSSLYKHLVNQIMIYPLGYTAFTCKIPVWHYITKLKKKYCLCKAYVALQLAVTCNSRVSESSKYIKSQRLHLKNMCTPGWRYSLQELHCTLIMNQQSPFFCVC